MLRDLLCHYIRFWLASHQETRKDIFFTEAIEIIKAIESKDEFNLRTSTSAHIKASLNRIMKIS
jgi:DNA-binding GntR family transcriptional regulator